MPIEGDELGALVVDDRGELAVSTSRERTESRMGGFDPREFSGSAGAGGAVYRNLYAQRCYGIDVRGHLRWEHRDVRIVRAIPEGWAALTDLHDLVLINHEGVAKRRGRLRGDAWRICGWRAGKPILTSDPEATWADPFVYSVRDRQLQYANEAGKRLGAVDLERDPFDDELRRVPPPAGVPDSFLFPAQMRLSFLRERGSLIATHRFMGWVASITPEGELSWVRLIENGCCNSACVVGDRIVHTIGCGGMVTMLAGDGRVLASRHVPHAQDAVSDGRGGLCLRAMDGLYGVDENLEPTWSLSTDKFPRVTAHDGVLYVVAGRPGTLVLTAYALA